MLKILNVNNKKTILLKVNCFINKILYKQRHYYKNMDIKDLQPPENVRHIRILDRELFKKIAKVPKLIIEEDKLNKILPLCKKYLLKMEHFKPVRVSKNGCKEILLHPLAIKSFNDLPISELKELNVDEKSLVWDDVELNYDNWKVDDLLKSILPIDQEGVTSYSKIGHIIHLNLRDHLIDYKNIIGLILKDKIPGCRTVVNKLQSIENTYRNFQMELICGDLDYHVNVKESGNAFEFDFSAVYWNPRLSSEHDRIVEILRAGDKLYDVFAGVGPFTVPAAKKKCFILANDLNPESYKWLNVNIKKNKVSNYVKTFNKDGNDFILNNIKTDLIDIWTNNTKIDYKIHITMNLPAMAVEFLNNFNGLLNNLNCNSITNRIYPLVHCYCFVKTNIDDNWKELGRELIEKNLKHKLTDDIFEGIYFVRNVAPNKNMLRCSFYLNNEILFNKKRLINDVDDNDVEINLNNKKNVK